MRERLENHALGRLTEISTEQLPKDGSRYRVTVAIPGKSKTSRALPLRSEKNGRKALPNSRIHI